MKKILTIGMLLLAFFNKNYAQTKIEGEEYKLCKMSFAFVSNVTNAPLGLSTWIYANKNKIALYLDYKFGSKSTGIVRGEEVYDISRAQAIAWGDTYIGREQYTEDKKSIFDIGIGVQLVKGVYGFGGIGYFTNKKVDAGYLKYYDAMNILGDNGSYWIRDYTKISNENKINFNCGFMFKAPQGLIAIVGLDTAPFGIELGLGYSF